MVIQVHDLYIPSPSLPPSIFPPSLPPFFYFFSFRFPAVLLSGSLPSTHSNHFPSFLPAKITFIPLTPSYCFDTYLVSVFAVHSFIHSVPVASQPACNERTSERGARSTVYLMIRMDIGLGLGRCQRKSIPFFMRGSWAGSSYSYSKVAFGRAVWVLQASRASLVCRVFFFWTRRQQLGK